MKLNTVASVPVVTVPNPHLNAPAMFSHMRNEEIDNPYAWDDETFYFGDDLTNTEVSPTAQPSIWDTISTGLQKIIPAYSQYKVAETQADIARQLNEINLARAKVGQPALDLSTYQQQMTVPTAQVQIGTSPQVQNMLKWGAIALAVGFGVYMFANR